MNFRGLRTRYHERSNNNSCFIDCTLGIKYNGNSIEVYNCCISATMVIMLKDVLSYHIYYISDTGHMHSEEDKCSNALSCFM